jgi:hypothetical protein
VAFEPEKTGDSKAAHLVYRPEARGQARFAPRVDQTTESGQGSGLFRPACLIAMLVSVSLSGSLSLDNRICPEKE